MATPEGGLPQLLELGGSPPFTLRLEEPDDFSGVRDVVLAAMRPLEAAIVDALRAGEKIRVALVAAAEGRIVGQVLFSPMTFDDGEPPRSALCLGPLAVHPEYQNRGIGSALVRAGLDECRRQGYGSVLLWGHPAYYPRFGFRPAESFSIFPARPTHTPGAFQAIELQPGALSEVTGIAHEAPEFGVAS